MAERVLVTGGAGFIGSHVADETIRLGLETVALDDLSGGFKENVNAKAEFIEGSINDETLVNALFEKYKFKYVYHLAAYAAEGLSHFIKRYNYENNLVGSINLINASVNYGVKCFVFTSSIAVYGKNQLPMTEDMTPQPEDSYGIAKFAVEQELKVTKELFGLDYVIFRPHNVYGERQNVGDKYRNVIGIFMNQIMQGKPLSIFGNGEQSRAFSYIGDVAPIIGRAPLLEKAYSQVFNIGAEVPCSINKLAEMVSKAMGVKPNVVNLPARNEVLHAYPDHSKIKVFFNYQAKIGLDEGIKRMAAWAKKAGAREGKEFSKIEIRKNLSKTWQPK
jgi:UDP-glucose 4-epimerase